MAVYSGHYRGTSWASRKARRFVFRLRVTDLMFALLEDRSP